MITDDCLTSPETMADEVQDTIPLRQPSQEENQRLIDHFDAVPFEEYHNDITKVKANERSRHLLAACFGVVPNFSLKEAPYCNLSVRQLPTNKMLKEELQRRDSSAKGLRQKKADGMISMLKSAAFLVMDQSDIDYIIQSECSMREVLLESQKEAEDESERKKENAQIKYTDRLRFIEAILSDRVKELYRKSQDCFTKNELDARNSVLRVVDFYDKVSEIFNDPEFEPHTEIILDLHEAFSTSIKLPLLDYRMSRDKAKDLLVSIRPKLAKMLHNYELSGSGSGMMREEGNEMYGHFDAELCVDGDDRRSFLLAPSDYWLLYWWHRLDTEQMLQFTICILDKFQRANAETFALVARERDATKLPSTATSEKDKGAAIAQNVAVVGEGVKSLSYATIFCEIETCKEKVCNLELLLLKVEG